MGKSKKRATSVKTDEPRKKANERISGISKPRTRIEPSLQSQKKLKKRIPQRPATIPTDIYVSRKSNFKGQLFRAKKLLLEDGHPSITIHGLGAAILKSINLVLTLGDLMHNQIIYKVTTGTVELVDDIIPEDDDKDLEIQTRNNSSVHIQVSLKDDASTRKDVSSVGSGCTARLLKRKLGIKDRCIIMLPRD
ncbi:9061_t:CDS:2 [Acaulospora morrowiae]|uniref:9061_t:CDS:1 n=1 Tax=Acaulospora morrowiae TaxID=94023 RepID=A0A9N8WCM5_9GLOM|nr:9061_t:CDS:2 [Acaulospora morrowiae]